MSAEVMRDMIRIMSVTGRSPLQAFFEEDILVPDVKPDVARIGFSDIVPKLTEKENYGGNLRLGGDLYLDVIYSPASGGDSSIEVVNTRIPFRHEADAEGISGEIEVIPKVEHLEVSIVNERKLRMKTVISFAVREYEDIERNIFRGFRNEQAELLETELIFTDIAEHKKDYIEVKEEVHIKDGMPEIGSVLKNNFRVAETYRQVSSDKAIISGSIYFDILYLSDESDPEPVCLPGKIDFTQFIKLDGGIEPVGSDILMRIDDVRVVPKKDAEDNMTVFDIMVGLSTRADVYAQKTINLIQDGYHSSKVLDLEKDEVNVIRLGGSGSVEVSIREKVNIAGAEDMEKIIFAWGEVLPTGGEIDNGKFVAEGVIVPELAYTCADDSGLRSTNAEIPFRTIVDVPGLRKGMNVNVDFVVKKIEAEKINNHQAEVYAEILVTVKGHETKRAEYIKNAGMYEDMPENTDNISRLIVYVTRNNDQLWDIGKRYRIPMAELKKVNGIDEAVPVSQTMKNGDKLLIWA